MPKLPVFKQLSAENPDSPFSHMRFHTVDHGKMLVFGSGNIIRAGKYTHADAICCLLAFFRWARAQMPTMTTLWPGAISMPNSVLTGQFTTKLDASIKTNAAATSSLRFPGISIALKNCTDNITPELFTKDAKWILPGVKQAPGAFEACCAMTELCHPKVFTAAATSSVPLP